MKMNELLLAQLEREARGTREALERVPEGKHAWTPHPKSMPLGRLAALIARMPSWVATIVDATKLDLAKRRFRSPSRPRGNYSRSMSRRSPQGSRRSRRPTMIT